MRHISHLSLSFPLHYVSSFPYRLLLCVLPLTQAEPPALWPTEGKDENQTHLSALPTALTYLASKPGTQSFRVPQPVSLTIVQSHLSAQETSSH